MNFYDFIIIYLACGAPFGVFYFVNQRKRESHVLIRTFLITLFWFPFAFRLLQKVISKKSPSAPLSKKEILRDEEINATKKDLERIFLKHDVRISIFELREVFDRYIGLTMAAESQEITTPENSLIFKVAGNQNAELASTCYQRRNRKLLSFHQTLAGQDFFKLISEFVARFPDAAQIESISLKLVKVLDDETTEKSLRKLFRDGKQSAKNATVSKTEKEIWITDLQTQSSVNALQLSTSRTAAKIRLPIKD